jgi:ABC-type lipoprotein release transport system permease subunit
MTGLGAMLALAWRNVWRNFRRSLITTASMGCGLAAIMFGQSMIISEQHQLVEKATGSITGHIQIQARNIKDYKFPDHYLEGVDKVEEALRSTPEIAAYGRRIHLTGLISSPAASVGALISSVEPQVEPRITTMSTYVTDGKFLSGPKTVTIGDKLAQRLDVRVGEKVVVMAQADDGSMGAEAYRVSGIFHTGSTTFDGQIVYVPLPAMQELLATGAHINHFVARLKYIDDADRVQQELREKLRGLPVQVLSWKDVDHEIMAIQKFQNGLLDIVLLIIFSIVALGILNTLLMSLFERVREFGVLMAIGAKPRWVLKLVLIESVTLGAVGMLLGLAAGSAMIAYFHRAGLPLPIGDAMSYFIPFPRVIFLRFAWAKHLSAAAAILVVSILAAVPPALRAMRLRPAEALRHV